MDSITCIKAFNNLILQFIGELKKHFPHEKDIVIFESKLSILSSTNPRMVVEEFMNNILPYKDKIMNCDEDFFLNLDNLNLNKEAYEKGLSFKSLYKSSDKRTKATIIAYFQKLIKIGEKV
jgi:hypothetical protein